MCISREQMPENVIADILNYQDLERIGFSNALKENPSDYSQYVNDNLNSIINDAENYKKASFQKAHADMARYMDMDHNANNFKVRNNDVYKLQDIMDSSNKEILNSAQTNLDNSKRQFEINEYYYYNKLETLFFLQLFFISTLIMSIVVYAQKKGKISTEFSGMITLILLVVVVVTGVYRWYYTKNTRDTRLWHRRTFAAPENVSANPSMSCDPSGNVVFDVNSILPASATRCASSVRSNMEQKYNDIKNKLENDTIAYMNTGKVPVDPNAAYDITPNEGGIFAGCSAS